MATYVNDLRLKEITTGDESGTWGTSTNTNLELIAEAFSFGTEAISGTATITPANNSEDITAVKKGFFKFALVIGPSFQIG